MRDTKSFAVMEVSSRGGISKKRRVSASSDSSLVELEDHLGFFVDSPDIVVSASNFGNSGGVVPGESSCSSFRDESGEVVKCTLAYKDAETRNRERIKSAIATYSKFSQTVQLREYSQEAHSPAKKPSSKSHQRTFEVGKIPPRIEIEAFFAEAEKYEPKRFAEKYNFDIVNDEPLEGRYLWLPLKHEGSCSSDASKG